MSKYIWIFLLLFKVTHVNAQAASYSDPAAAYLRILLEKSGEGSYQVIGNYKVIGTSYLFGEKLKGNVYTSKEQALNTLLSYNTYNHQLEVYQDNNQKPLVKKVTEVDSFRLLSSISTPYKEDLLFVNPSYLDSSLKKFFVVQVKKGNRFSLYKAYKSDMIIVSTNYVQSDLRQFDLSYEYYYKDVTKPGLKKLKVNANNLKREFKDIIDISSYTNSESFGTDTEYVLKQIFTALNHE